LNTLLIFSTTGLSRIEGYKPYALLTVK